MENLSKIIDYEIVSQPQQVIVNGVSGEVIKKSLVLSCPTCKSPLHASGFEGKLKDFFDVLEQQGKVVDYCPVCGQKLTIPVLVNNNG